MSKLQEAINDKKERDLFDEDTPTFTIPSTLDLDAEIFLKIYKDDLLYVIKKEIQKNPSEASIYQSLKQNLHKRLKEVEVYLEGI